MNQPKFHKSDDFTKGDGSTCVTVLVAAAAMLLVCTAGAMLILSVVVHP